MEENENVEKENVENVGNVENAETEVVNETTSEETEKTKGVKNIFKGKKALLVVGVIVIIAICVLFNVFFNTKGKAKKVAKQYIEAMIKLNPKKMLKLTDPYGAYIFRKTSDDDYDDFWEDYEDFVKEKDDDYDDVKDAYEDSLDGNLLDDLKDEMEDEMEDIKVKVKKIVSVKKMGKNLYRVKLKTETKEDGDKDTNTISMYVMKKGLNCYVVGGDGFVGYDLNF